MRRETERVATQDPEIVSLRHRVILALRERFLGTNGNGHSEGPTSRLRDVFLARINGQEENQGG